jgi:hypothetical protein
MRRRAAGSVAVVIMDRATGPRRGTMRATDHADARMSRLGLLKRQHGRAVPPTSVFRVLQVHRAPPGVIIHQIESVRSERPCMSPDVAPIRGEVYLAEALVAPRRHVDIESVYT